MSLSPHLCGSYNQFKRFGNRPAGPQSAPGRNL